MKLIIASSNRGKIREYKDIFEPYGFQVYSQDEENIFLEVAETGSTFEQNAALKARAIYEIAHCCVISDDSGLEVEALAVLKGLEGSANRKARFVTCICFIDETGEEHLFTGIWNGKIALKEEGTNGFGYDPIFISEDGNGKTTASLPLSFKETCSHRAKAVRKLISWLQPRNSV